MARLVIFDEAVRGIDLPQREVIIGRSRRVDVHIQDGLLSRKHCSIMPSGTGYRLWDLKSQNGTFLNGDRVERSELNFDDVIEIGRTVMVFLDTVDLKDAGESWKEGKGLARLRNPAKARNLIERIREDLKDASDPGYPVTTISPRESRESEDPEDRLPPNRRHEASAAFERELFEALRGDGEPRRLVVDLLEQYLIQEVVGSLVRRSPRLRTAVSELVQDLRGAASTGASIDELRRRVREALSPTSASRGGESSEPPVAETPGGEPAGGEADPPESEAQQIPGASQEAGVRGKGNE